MWSLLWRLKIILPFSVTLALFSSTFDDCLQRLHLLDFFFAFISILLHFYSTLLCLTLLCSTYHSSCTGPPGEVTNQSVLGTSFLEEYQPARTREYGTDLSCVLRPPTIPIFSRRIKESFFWSWSESPQNTLLDATAPHTSPFLLALHRNVGWDERTHMFVWLLFNSTEVWCGQT